MWRLLRDYLFAYRGRWLAGCEECAHEELLDRNGVYARLARARGRQAPS
jgi:hypothetical protein